MTTSDDTSLHALDDALRHGRGREQVTDQNVDVLIALAHQRGDDQTELLLREWRSPCGDDPEAPVQVSVSDAEGARMLDGGDGADGVPMPQAVHAWLGACLAQHRPARPHRGHGRGGRAVAA